MSTPRTGRAPGATAVLHVAPTVVEWLERIDGVAHLGRAVPAGTSPAEIVAAVVLARREAGGRTKRVVLALADALAPDRILQLPSDLSRKDLRSILERKAVALLHERISADAEEPTALFHAWAGGQVCERDGDHTSWHLVAMDEEFLTKLSLALRDRNFRVERVAALQLAPLALASASTGNTGEPVLYVVTHDERMDVGLIVEDHVLTRRSMEGNPATNTTVATGLFHEVRGIAGFWRKQSRGDQIRQVVLIGLPTDRAQLIASAIGGVLPDAKVSLLPDPEAESADAEELRGRATILSAARTLGPLSPNLAFRLPPRRVSVGLAALLCGLLAFVLGTRVEHHLIAALGDLQGDNLAMTTQATELRTVHTRLEVVESDAAELRQVLERTARVGTFAPPLRPLLTESLAALPENAVFDSIRLFDSGDRDYRLEVQGSVHGSAGSVLRGMRSLRDYLGRSSHLSEVDVTLSDRLPEDRNASQAFLVTAHCRETSP